MFRKIAVFLLCAGILTCEVSAYSGEMPKQTSYDYTYYAEATAAPEAYEFDSIFSAETLGIESFKGLSDLCTDDNGNIYLLDTATGRIIKTDSECNLIKEQSKFVFDGKTEKLSLPEGISFGNDGFIYVADTANGRVIRMDKELNIIKIFTAPDKEQAQYDFEYMPSKVAADSEGRFYVVAKSQTQGVFQFDASGKFMRYIGASKVKTSFQQILYRLFASREQLEGMMQFIPTEYNNISMDEDGFIFGTISAVDSYDVLGDVTGRSNNTKMVRRINQSGKDISVTNGTYAPLGDLDFTVKVLDVNTGASTFVDVATYNNGVYSVLDSRRGRVFTYNCRSELMYIFGSRGDSKESFKSPVAIDYYGDKIIVADQADGIVHVFKPTAYAKLIMLGNSQYEAGDYEAEAETWRQLLKIYPGSELGNVGMGRALYSQGKYKEALECFKRAQNRSYYSKALKYYIRELGIEYAPYLVGGLVLVVLIIFVIRKVAKKYHKERAKSDNKFKTLLKEIKYASYISFHPFDGFWDLKNEKRGSVKAATCILTLTLIVNTIYIRLMPFLFNDTDFTKTSALVEGVLGILALVILWTVCNWALTTITNGKGTIKDIYKYTCYSLWPMIVVYPIIIIASYVLTDESAAFLSILSALVLVWVVFLIFAGTSSTHQYTPLRTVVTMIITVVGIMIVLFVLLLTFSLVQQIFTFVSLLMREISLNS